jgi:hypothetical protein
MQKSFTKRTLLAIVTSLCIWLTASNAEAVLIRGATSCGTWVDQTKEDGILIRATRMWLIGYLSGRVMESGRDVMRGTDNPSFFLWVDNYCKANPLKHIDDAGDALFSELAKKTGR